MSLDITIAPSGTWRSRSSSWTLVENDPISGRQILSKWVSRDGPFPIARFKARGYGLGLWILCDYMMGLGFRIGIISAIGIEPHEPNRHEP